MRKIALSAAMVIVALVAAIWMWPNPEGEPGLSADGHPSSDLPQSRRPQTPATGARAEEPPSVPFDAAKEESATPGTGTASGATLSDGELEVSLSAGGKPIPGASVRLYFRGARDPNTNAVDWRAAGAAATGEDGTARLPARPGSYLVSARAEGYATARKEVLRPHGEKLTQVFLLLERGTLLTGRTVSRGRREPVPLAELTLVAEGAASSDLWRRVDAPAEERVLAASDRHGRFQIPELAPGAWRVEARAVGYAPAIRHSVTVPRAGELVIELVGSAFIEGFVTASDGSAAAGAQVSVAGGEDEVVVSTGQGGGYSAEVGPGTFTVSAKRGSESGSLPTPISVAAGASVRGANIRLGAGCSIEGAVVAKASGAPIAGASVNVSPYRKTGDSGRAVSDVGGAYSVAGLAPGSYDVVVNAAGFAQLDRRGITVAAGQRFVLRLEMQGTGAVEGTVSDEAGRPIAGAVVRGGNRFGGPGPSEAEARCDEQGRYRLADLEAGKVRMVARRADAAAGASKLIEVLEEQTARADFVIADSGFVTGTVTRKSGAPIEGLARVRAMLRTRGRMGAPETALANVEPGGGYHLSLPPGRWSLKAALNPGFGEGVSVDVESSKTSRLDLVLSEDQPGGVAGIVLEPGGGPSARASVLFAGSGDRNVAMSLSSDEEGRFQLPNLAWLAGMTLSAQARNGGRTSEWVRVTVNGPELTLQLRPAATLMGKVVPGDGVAVSGFSVRLSFFDAAVGRGSSRGGDLLEFTGDRFELTEVPAERMKLSVRATDGRSGEAEATLTPGGRAEVTVLLQQGATLTGVVLASDTQKPVTDASLTLDGRRNDGANLEIASDGRFRLNVSPGEHSLRIWAPVYRANDRKVTVAVGQSLDLGQVVLTRQQVEAGTIGAGFGSREGNVQVTWLFPEGPAERSGLREGDRVVSIDATPVRHPADATRRARGAPGTAVSVTVRRGSGEQTFPMTRAN